MPKITDTLTREQIEQEAAAAEQRAAMLREQMWLEDEAKRQQRADVQREWDEQFVASISRAQLFSDAERARAELLVALAENLLIAALGDYFTALRRRSHLVFELNQALDRLGQPASPVPAGMQTELTAVELLDLLQQTAERIATERIDTENADRAASRDAAGLA
jgi:hypothetical protein